MPVSSYDVSSARGDRAAGRHHLRQEDLEGAGAVGVALEEALLLQDLELVGHAGGAGQADRVADLAHARRVAALLDGVLDVGQHALLPRGEAGGVGGPSGSSLTFCAPSAAGLSVLLAMVLPSASQRTTRAGPGLV